MHEQRGLGDDPAAREARPLGAEPYEAQERLLAIGQLVGGIAHDFANIVSSMSCYVQLLRARADLAPDVEEDLDALSHSSRRAIELVDRLMSWSEPRSEQAEVLELTSLCRDVIFDNRRSFRGKIIDLEGCGEEVFVCVNRSLLERSLLNLLVNAHEATTIGAVIVVRLSVNVHGAELSVVDTGSGIAPDLILHATEPFVSSKKRGTGLGLASVRQFAEGAGGRLALSSSPGSETIVSISLPRAQAPQRHSDGAISGVRLNRRWTALVCSSDGVMNRGLCGYLKLSGCTVISSQSAGDALLAAEKIAETLDVAVLVEGSDWVSLEELVSRLATLRPQLQFILVGEREQQSAPGIEYLRLPIHPEAVVEKMEELYQRQRRHRAHGDALSGLNGADTCAVNV